MTKLISTCHQPSHSQPLFSFAKVRGALPLLLCPRENSSIRIGIPAVTKAKKYGMRNAPPPLSNAMYGNRQMFPKPIAEPTAARINPALLPHVSLFICYPPVVLYCCHFIHDESTIFFTFHGATFHGAIFPGMPL